MILKIKKIKKTVNSNKIYYIKYLSTLHSSTVQNLPKIRNKLSVILLSTVGAISVNCVRTNTIAGSTYVSNKYMILFLTRGGVIGGKRVNQL